ncbi:hypothetical protein LEP1GSC128_1994 [Leptospira borgpetersenii str. 200801926]|uniref:Uncharacterized protein n=2 Tax=Leptospira borgpetersenii TaxID=174 RepID=M3HSN1_LEPBO|nr:hypothetical protein LEP1GSC128_1994 [Leptospira borgpetersenii str. 200801926]EKQ98545.1 hypothetical protein LEP1GSC121_3422 [Leptospira borgpetersenii serovar Castellonis str. 200801910]EMG01046.1 hypothetical protein LEP1GSC123_3643 [Leptospira borgpetersenii str. 200701203]
MRNILFCSWIFLLYHRSFVYFCLFFTRNRFLSFYDTGKWK